MARNTYHTSSNARKGGDAAAYKIMGAVLLLAVSVFLMRLVANNYGTIDGADTIERASKLTAIVFGLLAAASLAVLLAVRSGWLRKVSPYVLAVSVLYAFSGLLLWRWWTTYISMLTFLHVAVYCLYIVYMLYQMEFFLVSLTTVVAGGTFLRYSRGIGANAPCIALAVVLVLVIASGAYIAANAAKNKGVLVLGAKRIRLFHARFNPLALYITCAVWTVCFAACLVFGAAFAYYCMFAAVAFELAAAVYYTFQLK